MRITVAPGRRLFVDVKGAALVPDGPRMREKPVRMLLHGGPGFDHSGFRPVFSRLADLVQIVYYDHRGNGRSDPCPPDEFTLDTLADDVVRLAERLGVEKPIVLGQSFGGFVAQRYLARHPDHPANVVLSSLAPHERRASRDALRLVGRSQCRSGGTRVLDRCRQEHMGALRCGVPAALQPAASEPDASTRVLFQLAGVRCPVLVMAGARDPICPVEDSHEIAAAIPAPWGRPAVFEHSRHGAWRDEADAAFVALREFVVDST